MRATRKILLFTALHNPKALLKDYLLNNLEYNNDRFRRIKRVQSASFPTKITPHYHVMKSIDIYAMKPGEAMVEAANANDLKWLRSLLSEHDDEVRDEAFISAAKDGYIRAVRVLMLEIVGAQTGKLDDESFDVIADAAVEAAAYGHLDVVELLLRRLQLELTDERDNSAWDVLEEASANGHLNVVKLAAEYTSGTLYLSAGRRSEALALATEGGHVDVAKFLLEPGRFLWSYAREFDLALNCGRDAIADLIYASSPMYKGRTLFCHLAITGNLNGITYLFEKGHNSPELVDEAFVQAAGHGRISVVNFLLRRGSISPETFDLAFESAATFRVPAVLKILYDEHRVSRAALVAAFEPARSAAAIEFILCNESVFAESVVAASKNAG